jgi:hypothetical protein
MRHKDLWSIQRMKMKLMTDLKKLQLADREKRYSDIAKQIDRKRM